MMKNVLNKLGFVRIALLAGAGFPFIIATNGFAQAPPPRRHRAVLRPLQRLSG